MTVWRDQFKIRLWSWIWIKSHLNSRFLSPDVIKLMICVHFWLHSWLLGSFLCRPSLNDMRIDLIVFINQLQSSSKCHLNMFMISEELMIFAASIRIVKSGDLKINYDNLLIHPTQFSHGFVLVSPCLTWFWFNDLYVCTLEFPGKQERLMTLGDDMKEWSVFPDLPTGGLTCCPFFT